MSEHTKFTEHKVFIIIQYSTQDTSGWKEITSLLKLEQVFGLHLAGEEEIYQIYYTW